MFKGNGDMIEGHFENGLIKGKATFYPNNGIPYDINTEEDVGEENVINENINENDEMNYDDQTTCDNTNSNIKI